MVTLDDVKREIAEAIAAEKAYGLPRLCVNYGLDDGSEDEAYRSKRSYVLKRLAGKDREFILELSKRVMEEYPTSNLGKVLSKYFTEFFFNISNITRDKILKKLNEIGKLEGELEIVEFLDRVFNIKSMPSEENEFDTFEYDVIRHMRCNDDWDYYYLLKEKMNLLYVSDKVFINFLEQIVHPYIRKEEDKKQYINEINKNLAKDGYELVSDDVVSGETIYKVRKTVESGVTGQVKNLIFASDGPKPEIIFSDLLNNDIEIVKNKEHCLIYCNSIGRNGLRWGQLVEWWEIQGKSEDNTMNVEQSLYKRLAISLDNEIEKKIFYTYYKEFKPKLQNELPVLIPQVYLHYDPLTIKQLRGEKRLIHQRMDFLMLISDRDRIVIELDGKQHYSNGDISSPKKYSEMVAADRKLTLNGYKIFRFGGYELKGKDNAEIIKTFFSELLENYRFDLR